MPLLAVPVRQCTFIHNGYVEYLNTQIIKNNNVLSVYCREVVGFQIGRSIGRRGEGGVLLSLRFGKLPPSSLGVERVE